MYWNNHHKVCQFSQKKLLHKWLIFKRKQKLIFFSTLSWKLHNRYGHWSQLLDTSTVPLVDRLLTAVFTPAGQLAVCCKSYHKKMATSKTNQNSSDFEEYIRDLLECPVCMETIKSVPVYQCVNGHVICKGCIEKLNNCPICRNDSSLRRSLKLEKIVQRLEGIQPENGGNPNLQKWGKGSVRVYGTIDGPNQESRIELNPQANPGQARQATPRQVTPRQVLSRQYQDLEAALERERAENWNQCLLLIFCIFFTVFCCFLPFFINYLHNSSL